MLILFLLTSHLKRLLTSALIHFLKIRKKQKFYQKQNLRNFYLLLQKNLILFLTESSTSKSMESLWVRLYVQRWLVLFQYILKRIGHKIVHLTLWLITTGGILMISFFHLPHQNILKSSKIFQMVDILTCHLQLNVKSKTECLFQMYRLFVKIKHLPLLSTVNLPLVEFIHILTVFYHLPIGLVLFTHSLIDALEFALVGLNYTMNQFV